MITQSDTEVSVQTNGDNIDHMPSTSIEKADEVSDTKPHLKPAVSYKKKKRRPSGSDIIKSLSIDFESKPADNLISNEGDKPVAITSRGSALDPIVSPVVLDPSAKRRRHYNRHHGTQHQQHIDQPSLADQDKIIHPVEIHENVKTVVATKDTIKKEETTESKLPSGAKNPNAEKFRYGNYNRYYGKRLHVQSAGPDDKNCAPEDARLKHFDIKWFEGKRVLDIGCNIGLVTLHIAKHLKPHSVVGVDIDPHLIGVARKNIRFYLDEGQQQPEPFDTKRRRFPLTFSGQYGPLAAPPVAKEPDDPSDKLAFPNNVIFKTLNYVPDNDAFLDMVHPEYDIILALSITKWIHLNWGDDGLKRFFKRMFKHLLPGGILFLEPQTFVSYNKRKKLTPEIEEHYKKIEFKPDQFNDYLLSDEVGFETYQLIANPEHKNHGFRRPVFMFKKKPL